MKEKRSAQYIADRENGMSCKEIAEKYGISRQAVYAYCARRGIGHFRNYTKEEVVYPELRKWLNENKVSRSELARRMDCAPVPRKSKGISEWLKGKNHPRKDSIDKLLAVTGLTYEQLFYREDR